MGEGRAGGNARDAATVALATLSRPIVVVALVLLVVNDHVLKRAWPGLITGKLSDIAWPLVAAPLVALALAPLARWCGWRRWTLVVVLVTGLPLVAVNVSPTAAGFVGGLLTILVGPSTITTDPSDLVVVFPALYASYRLLDAAVDRTRAEGRVAAEANTHPVGSPVPRRPPRPLGWLSLPLVGLAAFGTAATSCDESGIPAVLALEVQDGALYADVNGVYAVSHDGGRSWERFEGDDIVAADREQRGPWLLRPSEDPACTDEHCYRIDGFGIQDSVDGETWNTLWRPLHTRDTFLERQRRGGSCPDTRPPARPLDLDVVLDPASPTGHHLVVAMGLDGVMVGDGTRDGDGGARFERVDVLGAAPPAETGLLWNVLAPEIAAASWLAGLVWVVGSILWWFRLRHLHEPGRRSPTPLWPILLTLFPVLLLPQWWPFGVMYFVMEIVFAWWLSTPIVLALIVGAALGWLIHATPRGWRHVPWRLAARGSVMGAAFLLPFVLWSLGTIPFWPAAALIALVLVPVAAGVPLGPRLTPPPPQDHPPTVHDRPPQPPGVG